MAKKIIPPTLQEMLDYQQTHPKLSGIDIPSLYEVYNEVDWIDTRGRKIVNWRLKLHTLAQYNPARLCGICGEPAAKYQIRDGRKFYLCPIHAPKETPQDNIAKPQKDSELVMQDKIREQVGKLTNSMSKGKGL